MRAQELLCNCSSQQPAHGHTRNAHCDSCPAHLQGRVQNQVLCINQHSASVYAALYLNAPLKGGFCFECSCQCLLLTGNQYIICFLESRHLSFRTRAAKFSTGGKLSSFDLTSLSPWMSFSLPRGREVSEKQKEQTLGYRLYLILPTDELLALNSSTDAGNAEIPMQAKSN